ncbi:hypothetical protein R3P38DRAFT_2575054 [Favolaschia claudopus]|uniref:Uncharacterized protein n=1 Tax=Favolaschia claudopus TaxID=2862362 RepID=A0AAV9ZLG0_9AGAR
MLQTLALEAYQGSRAALQEIVMLSQRRNTSIERALLLPVLYHNLRPPTQPNECSLDHPRAIAARIILHFRVFDNGMPREALLELWPRYWTWFQISNPIETDDTGKQQNNLSSLMLFLFEIFEHPDSTAIFQTPGLRLYVCQLWSLMLLNHIHDPSYTVIYKAIWAFLRFSCDPDKSDSSTARLEVLQEFIDGAGEVADFAALVIRHIGLFSSGRQQDVGPLDSLFCLLGYIDSGDGPFRSEIISRGVVQLVVRALAAFQNLPAESPVTPFTYGFVFLRSLLSTHPVYPWVKQAVKAGFLPLLMHCSMRREDLVTPQLLVEVINLLASSCIYHSVLPRLGTSMTGLGEIMSGPEFQNCRVRAQWLKFKAILFGRLSTLNELEASAPVTERACDNLEVGESPLIFLLIMEIKSVRKNTRQTHVSSLCSLQVHVLLLGYMPKRRLGWRQPSR